LTSYRHVVAAALLFAAAARADGPRIDPDTRHVLQAMALSDALRYLEGRDARLGRYYDRSRPVQLSEEQAARLAATDPAALQALAQGREVLVSGTVLGVTPDAAAPGLVLEMAGGSAELPDGPAAASFAHALRPGLRVELVCAGVTSFARRYRFVRCAPVDAAASALVGHVHPLLFDRLPDDPAVAAFVDAARRTADALPRASRCRAGAVDDAACARELHAFDAPARPPQPPAVAESEVFRSPPAIDCGAPTSTAQGLICTDVELGQRELALRKLFDGVQVAAYTRSPEASKALLAAHAASAAERDTCVDRPCLEAWFANREAQLRAQGGGAR